MTPLAALLAHPLTESGALPLPPLVLAFLAALVVVAVALLWPPRPAERVRAVAEDRPDDPWTGRLSPLQRGTRAAAVALLVLAVLAGRVGSESELDNLAPALVVGAGWPLLLLATVLLGAVWRWIDPWDGVVRALQRDPDAEPAADVRPALVAAIVWVWYLSASFFPLAPRSVAALLAAYALLAVAGALAFGRVGWLSRVDALALLLTWTAKLRRGRLSTWSPPRGADLLLGVLAGGLLFGSVRLSPLWGELNIVALARLWATLGVLAAAAIGAAGLWLLARWASRLGAPGAVAAAAVPAVVAVALALAMARNRLFTSVQLLPIVASDPLGRGWDLFGTSDWLIHANPLGTRGRALLQLGTLLAGHVAAGIVLARRVEDPAGRVPGLLGIVALLFAAVAAVTAL